MTLRELLGDGPDVVVTGLTFDNRQVAPGTLFFCVPGFTRDGHDFAPDAVARGAAALVVAAAARPRRARGPSSTTCGRRWRVAAARFYGDPTARAARRRDHRHERQDDDGVPDARAAGGRGAADCGLLGTVKSVVGGEERPVVRTTPEAIDLQRTFREMLDAGDAACAMEISSHALELRRADGIHVAAAVFTNLTQDHLDFHPDMEATSRPSGCCSRRS